MRAVQNHAVVQVNLTDISGNNNLPEHVEVHKAGSYIHNYFGASMDADSIDNIIIDCAVSIAPDGTITAYLPERRYYALVTQGEEAGKIYAFRVTSQEIQTVVLKEIIIEPFSTNVQRRNIQARRIIPNVELNGVSITVYEGRNQTTGTPVHIDTTVREGLVGMLLPEGIYTVVASDGTTTKHFNIIINGDYTCYTVRF